MATIHTKSSKNMLILDSREHEIRQTNMGTDWHEVRIGGIFVTVPNGDPEQATPAAETIPYVTYLDRFTFGLRNSGSAIPGQDGCNFLGISTNNTQAVYWTPFENIAVRAIGSSVNGELRYAAFSGSSVLGMTSGGKESAAFQGPTLWGAAGIGNFFGIRYIVNNSGSVNQTITMDTTSTTNGILSLTESNAILTLSQLLTTSTYSNQTILVWNDGVSAMPLPDSWMLRTPFLTMRLSTLVMGGIRIS